MTSKVQLFLIVVVGFIAYFLSSKMIRPRGGLTRTILDKMEKDRQLAAMDKSKWYKINETELENLSLEVARKFEMLDFDEETSEFLDSCIVNSDSLCWQIYVNVATSLLSWFMSPTSINGFLGRGSMQVFSKAQFRSLIGWDGQLRESLLDIGAGDGSTTSQMSPCFSQVFVTEMSSPMKRVLIQKGFKVANENSWSDDANQYDMISCLNVLDRCDEPVSLLAKMRQKLSRNGVALVAFVIPFKPYVEFESKTHQPKELLPIKGTSFEVEVVNFVEKVLKPRGWELIKWSRLPYLCDGDIHQAYYWLQDAIFLIRPSADWSES